MLMQKLWSTYLLYFVNNVDFTSKNLQKPYIAFPNISNEYTQGILQNIGLTFIRVSVRITRHFKIFHSY